MRLFIMLISLVGAVSVAVPRAHAETRPNTWCLKTDGSPGCIYATSDECLQDRLGRGGFCTSSKSADEQAKAAAFAQAAPADVGKLSRAERRRLSLKNGR